MMTNLFSIFDPSTSIMKMNMNWISTMLGMMLIPSLYWTMKNRYMMNMMKPLNKMNNEFKMLINMKTNKGSTLMFTSMFTLIMMNNLMGLCPYLFTSTSHMAMTLPMAMPLWMSFMMMGWLNKTNKMFTHLVPMNTPMMLMPFMVCIETISNLIRPMTLSMRLAANMIAGHLIMTLLSNTTSSITTKLTIIMIMMQMLLMSLELAVAIIQAYVMAVLTMLYASEVN
uniref:ATP synthase subunit a n=1 Tax=Cryptophyllium westwoodii TaxID=2778107 RepID=A0A7T8IM32_9NEOP|nr:ATP synthase F0 subunit 6 [Cryptophyllium westwoodii]